MPSLFVLPRQVPLSSSAGLLAGAKLTFSATGSSTLQNTYSDIGLTTPNANPVIADGNGVFSKIYLDPGLPNYRVKLTTSADVLLYQEDDIPSGSEGIAAKAFKGSSTDRTSTTSIVDDPDLVFALQAGATYRIDVSLLFVGVTSGAQGFKWAIAYSGAAAIVGSATGIQSLASVGSVRAPFTPTSSNSIGPIATASNDALVYSFLFKTSSAGTLSVQWAQSSSSANATRLVTGSYMVATRLG